MSGGRPVSRDNGRTRPDKMKWPRHKLEVTPCSRWSTLMDRHVLLQTSRRPGVAGLSATAKTCWPIEREPHAGRANFNHLQYRESRSKIVDAMLARNMKSTELRDGANANAFRSSGLRIVGLTGQRTTFAATTTC